MSLLHRGHKSSKAVCIWSAKYTSILSLMTVSSFCSAISSLPSFNAKSRISFLFCTNIHNASKGDILPSISVLRCTIANKYSTGGRPKKLFIRVVTIRRAISTGRRIGMKGRTRLTSRSTAERTARNRSGLNHEVASCPGQSMVDWNLSTFLQTVTAIRDVYSSYRQFWNSLFALCQIPKFVSLCSITVVILSDFCSLSDSLLAISLNNGSCRLGRTKSS